MFKKTITLPQIKIFSFYGNTNNDFCDIEAACVGANAFAAVCAGMGCEPRIEHTGHCVAVHYVATVDVPHYGPVCQMRISHRSPSVDIMRWPGTGDIVNYN